MEEIENGFKNKNNQEEYQKSKGIIYQNIFSQNIIRTAHKMQNSCFWNKRNFNKDCRRISRLF